MKALPSENTHVRTHMHTRAHKHTHTHTHTHTHDRSLSLAPFSAFFLSLSLSHTHTHMRAHTHTRTHTHTHKHAHTHTHTHNSAWVEALQSENKTLQTKLRKCEGERDVFRKERDATAARVTSTGYVCVSMTRKEKRRKQKT